MPAASPDIAGHATRSVLLICSQAEDFQELLQDLQKRGLRWQHADSLPAALALLDQDPADLAVLAADLPGGRLQDLCRGLKSAFPDLPLLVLTSFAGGFDPAPLLDAGAADVASLTTAPTVLSDRIRGLLRLQRVFGARDLVAGLLAALLEEVRDPALLCAPNGRVFDCNAAALETVRQELQDAPLFELESAARVFAVPDVRAHLDAGRETGAVFVDTRQVSLTPIRHPAQPGVGAWLLVSRPLAEAPPPTPPPANLLTAVAADLTRLEDQLATATALADGAPDTAEPLRATLTRARSQIEQLASQLAGLYDTASDEARATPLGELLAGPAEALRERLPADWTLIIDVPDHLPPVRTPPRRFGLLVQSLADLATRRQSGPAELRVSAELDEAAQPLPCVTLRLAAYPQPETNGELHEAPAEWVAAAPGLSLAVVEGLRGAQGFEVREEADADGVVWTVRLPVAAPPPRDEPERLVMIVDDEELILGMLSDSLRALRYRALPAASGEAGLSLFRQYREQLCAAIIDVILPDYNGLQLVRQLQQEHPALPILVTSGFEYDAERLVSQFGVAGFLHKPFTLADLREHLAGLCGE